MRQAGQRIGPKIPHRAQQLGKCAEKQHCAAQGTQHQETPQLTIRPAQQKEEGDGAHGQAVGPVQQGGDPRAAEAKRTQHIVQHPGGQSQQNGLAKGQELD